MSILTSDKTCSIVSFARTACTLLHQAPTPSLNHRIHASTQHIIDSIAKCSYSCSSSQFCITSEEMRDPMPLNSIPSSSADCKCLADFEIVDLMKNVSCLSRCISEPAVCMRACECAFNCIGCDHGNDLLEQ